MAYDRSWLTMTVVDAYNRRKTKRVELASTDPAQMEIDAALLIAAFVDLMQGHVISASVTGANDYAGAAAAGANVDTGVTVSAQLTGRPNKATLKWPTPLPGLFDTNGNLDLTDVRVTLLESYFQTVTPAIAELSDGETIVDFLSGKLDK